MKAISIRVEGVSAPTEPCQLCGGCEWREAIPGELIGHICLGCGHNQLGQVIFGEPEEIDLSARAVENLDGSVTIDLSAGGS